MKNTNKIFYNSLLSIAKVFYLLVPTFLLAFTIHNWFIYTLTTIKMCSVFAISIVIFGYIYRSFDIKSSNLSKLITAQTITLILSYFIIQFTLFVNDRNYLSLNQSLILLSVSFLFFCFYTKLLILFKNFYIGPKKVLLITTNKNKHNLLKQMQRITKSYCVSSIALDTEDYSDITIKAMDVNAIVIDEINEVLKNKILNFCFFNKKEIDIIPSIEDLLINKAYPLHFIDSPFLAYTSFGPRVYQRIIKRLFDLIVATVALIIFSPLFLVISILIKLTDRGPIFYKQERMTLNGKLFYVFKFRSMVVDAEKNGAQLAKENDSRITPIGKILRSFRLDELPQLINIIKGDMSIVGPRPERPEIAKEYEKELSQFNYRLAVKAGLTGYAQIYGRYNTTPKDKLKLDLMYISSFSLLLDLELIFKTVQILFEKESTEGF